MRWKLSCTVLRGGTGGNTGPLLDKKIGKQKQPYLFTVGDKDLFAFAGLWEAWEGEDGEVVESCSILTTEANDLVRPLHDRMPVILPLYDLWLDPEAQQREAVEPLLKPYPAELMVAHPVSQWVNNARHEGPQCVEPVPA